MKDILGWINSKLDLKNQTQQQKLAQVKEKGEKVKINKATILWTIPNYLI